MDEFTATALRGLDEYPTGQRRQPTKSDIARFKAAIQALNPGEFERRCDARTKWLWFIYDRREYDMYYRAGVGWYDEKDPDS